MFAFYEHIWIFECPTLVGTLQDDSEFFRVFIFAFKLSSCAWNCEIARLSQKIKKTRHSRNRHSLVHRMGQVGLVFTFIVMGYSMALTFHFYTIGNCRTEIAKIQYHVCLHFFGRERITTGTPLPLRICTFQIANIVVKFYSKFTIQWF